MSPLTQEQINAIARQVADQILSVQRTGSSSGVPVADTVPAETGGGIFPDIDSAVEAATVAQKEFIALSLEKRHEIIAAIRDKMREHAEDLARRAHEETGLGRVEDKIQKNLLVTNKTPGPEVLQPVSYSGDRGLTLIERAPFGVLGAITPVTNPTSSIICNTIGMISAGNSVVFNVHPSAKNVSIYNIKLLNLAITSAGGPRNLVTAVANPTIETAGQLMKHPGIRVLVVTGGAGVVKAAMNSGKRAICAGPGNPPVVVDETADIEKAADYIVKGASLDNNIICVDEKEVFVVAEVYDRLLSALSRHGAVILTPEQIAAVEKVIFKETRGPRKPGVMNKDFIGKNVQLILAQIGMQVDDSIRLAVAPVDENHPLVWTEQMMPVLPVVKVSDVNRAIDLAKEAEHGFGHSAIMHSKNLDNLSRMAKVMNTSIFVKNSMSASGLGYGGEGYTSFTIASPTGEGLTDPRSFSRERRCVLVDHFRII